VSAGDIDEDDLDDALPGTVAATRGELRLALPSATDEEDASEIPPPPRGPDEVLAWAEAHGVAERLDDAFVDGTAGPYRTYGATWPGRPGERITYRRVLVDTAPGERQRWGAYGLVDDARQMLRRLASATAHHLRDRAWMKANGRDPEAPPLVAFLDLLRTQRTALQSERLGSGRVPGTYFGVGVDIRSAPTPALRYGERALNVGDHDPGRVTTLVTLALLAWNEAPLRWSMIDEYRRTESPEVPLDLRLSAVEAMVDFVRDPRRASERDELAELLVMPAWRFALGDLDRRLARLTRPASPTHPAPSSRSATAPSPDARVAFRVRHTPDGRWEVEPLLQKRQRRGNFSKGQRMEWYRAVERPELTESDRRVFRAHDDPFVRSSAWGPTQAQTFGVLTALIDHPAVVLEGPKGDRRPDIRQGRLRLRFGAGREGSLTPQLELVGHLLPPAEVAAAGADGRHLILLREGDRQAPQILLARLSPEASSLVGALALAPGSFPAEAHDALATRLEGLQEALDIEFPSQWTRTIAPADGRPLVRLELLGSGALHVKIAVRPVQQGPVFAPAEGPTLVLEGQGRERHGARRDPSAERQAALAMAERLELASAVETEAWSWRVAEGDPALHVVAALRELGDAVVVEWADDARLVSLGRVGRGDLRLQVADKRDWFGVDGGAEIPGGAGDEATVPLAQLFAAIRDGRRFVKVGGRGFVRIEDSLRAALARAEGVLFEHRGALQIAAVGTDALMGLVERQAQVEASASFRALRERMKESEAAEPRLAPAMAATLRPYQHAGVRWLCRLAHWGAGAILADEMGLGKTVQTLAVLCHRASLGPALVVAPTSVVPNWLAETARFAPELTVCDLRGPAARAALGSGARIPAAGELWVTSYAIATLEAETLARHRFATLIVDEAQAVKNATTDRARALRDLSAEWRLALTGTPIENRLSELWSILRVTSPGLLGSWEQFRARYAVPIEKFGDDGRRQALAALLRPFVLRRTKNEVARDLPDRTEVVRSIRLSADERALYEELRRATLEDLARAKARTNAERDASNMRFVLLASLTRLRQLCCHPRLVYPDSAAGSSKTAYLLELLGELREGGHKVLVFSQFRSLLELLAPRLVQQGHRVLVLDGTTPADARERRIAAFQAGEADVFLISLKAGGFGLNLTAADTVIHMDPWWNPAVEDQATARAHRIGQAKPVTAIRLVARETVEEAVLELHAAKRTLAAGVLEGSEVAAGLDDQQLAALIESGLDTPHEPKALRPAG